MLIKIFKLSIRGVLRDKRRSFVTFLISLTCFLLLGLYTGYLNTNQLGIKNWIFTDNGHLQVMNKKMPENIIESGAGSYEYMVSNEEYEKVKDICIGIKEIRYVTPKNYISGFAGTETGSHYFLGEAMIPGYSGNIIESVSLKGDFLNESNRNDIAIGKDLAENLNIKKEDTMLIAATSRHGSLEAVNARVAGIFDAGGGYAMNYMMYLNIDILPDLILPDSFNKLLIYLESDKDMLGIQEKLNSEFKKQGLDLKAYNVYQVASMMKQVIDINEEQANISVLVFSIVVFFSILNILYMSVTDKAKEFSTMRTLGVSRIVLFLVIIFEGLALVSASQIAGIIILKPAAEIINAIKIMLPPSLGQNKPHPFVITVDFIKAFGICGILICAGLFGGILPAISVVRQRIVKGLSAE